MDSESSSIQSSKAREEEEEEESEVHSEKAKSALSKDTMSDRPSSDVCKEAKKPLVEEDSEMKMAESCSVAEEMDIMQLTLWMQ